MKASLLIRISCGVLVIGVWVLPAQAQTDLGTWVTRAPLPTPRQEMPHVVLQGKVYVIGGLDNNATGSTLVDVYDPVRGTWAEAASLPMAMHHLAVAAVGGKIYVVGGYRKSGFTATDHTFVYDPVTDTWTEKSRMPASRGAHAAVAVGGKIYVFGGTQANTALATHHRYDPATDTWEERAPMSIAREHLAAVAIDGFIYAVGGRFRNASRRLENTGLLERYDPATDTWITLEAMPTPRGGLSAAVLHRKLYVFGGEYFLGREAGVFSENEVYHPATNTWTSEAPMPVPRHGMGAAAVADTIFIIGGGPEAGFATTDTNAGFVPPASAATAIEMEAQVPGSFRLHQNYPNPFNPVTTIRFSLSQAASVRLTVYDVMGREVALLADRVFKPGTHAVRWDAGSLKSGRYFYNLRTGTSSATRYLTLVK